MPKHFRVFLEPGWHGFFNFPGMEALKHIKQETPVRQIGFETAQVVPFNRAAQEINGNHKNENDKPVEKTSHNGFPTVLMPPQPSGYIKAPDYDFF